MSSKIDLPIDVVLPEVAEHLRTQRRTIIVAPPGAGKSTRVPPMILDDVVEANLKVIVLQPRRVAARTTASRIASERGCKLGGEVGYRVRHENKTSKDTRLLVVTEGMLTRMAQKDPLLEDIGCIIFDEFHERSLEADLGLAMVAEIQREVRPDLHVVVMSATMDPKPVAQWLSAPICQSEGRTFPVDIAYASKSSDKPVQERVALAVRSALKREKTGDILVFLPGVGEIRRSLELIQTDETVDVLPLYSALDSRAQDRALAAGPKRKVILSTNIAETSITLPGVTTVIDTGLARSPVFDPIAGADRLELIQISKASAEQRAGRAGRVRPGHCMRLWTEHEHRSRPADITPDVDRVDMTAALLQVRAWAGTPSRFTWYQQPGLARLAEADRVLQLLGALADDELTPLGKTLSELPVHPRLGRVIIEGHRNGCLQEAATFGALASERDIFRAPIETRGQSDLMLRVSALDDHEKGKSWPESHRPTIKRVQQTRLQLVRAVRGLLGPQSSVQGGYDAALKALITGFPERVGLRREEGGSRFILANGSGARLDRHSAVRDARLIIAVGLRAGRRGAFAQSNITIASAIEPEWLETKSTLETHFDENRGTVTQRRTTRYLELQLSQVQSNEALDPDLATQLLATAAAERPSEAFPLSQPATAQFLSRLRWLAARAPELNFPTLPELEGSGPPTDFITMVCYGKRSFEALQKIELVGIIKGLLSIEQQRALVHRAPPQFTLPDGTVKPLRYEAEGRPTLACRFERLFGLTGTPTIDGEAVLLELLAPNMRPVQVTTDLASFWASGYPAVRKELRGRYPKHPWPDDPIVAKPGVGRRRKSK